eukprot:SAG11_NODE_27909_length_327_cov_0.912281_1_plen_50_part_01
MWSAALGVELRARERRVVLPSEKVEKYCKDIDGMLAQASRSRKKLVCRDD